MSKRILAAAVLFCSFAHASPPCVDVVGVTFDPECADPAQECFAVVGTQPGVNEFTNYIVKVGGTTVECGVSEEIELVCRVPDVTGTYRLTVFEQINGSLKGNDPTFDFFCRRGLTVTVTR